MTDNREAKAATLWLRLGIGLLQGLAAWALINNAEKALGSSHPQLFAALVMVCAFPPLILLAGLGRMRPQTLAVWTAAATAMLAGLAVYDMWREPLDNLRPRHWPSPQLIFFGAAALYIGHHLIEPADRERRLNPSYQGRFEDAWRHGFQLALSLAFTGVFWGVLWLGSELFEMIGVKLLQKLLQKAWFNCPVSTVAFAAAVHLTDVRPGLISGVRTVGLTLLSWLLPLMAALTTAFLVALVFTGVGPLWGTHRASALLLSAAAVLVVLINAAYQDGHERELLPRVLRWTGRGAAVLLVPLVSLSIWATSLRIGQYGLTTERVVSFALLALATLYAGGYAWAGLTRGAWMKRLESVNVLAGGAVLASILLLLSPIADPTRLAVADQVGRLEAGRTAVEKFDFRFLRFDAGRYGRDALAGLVRSKDPKVAAKARETQAVQERYQADTPSKGTAFSNALILPAGAVLPDSFRKQAFTEYEAAELGCLRGSQVCQLYPKDLDNDGSPEVLGSQNGEISVFALKGGRWTRVGRYYNEGCAGMPEALARGEITTLPALFADLQVAGQRLAFQPQGGCTTPPNQGTSPKESKPGGLGPAFE